MDNPRSDRAGHRGGDHYSRGPNHGNQGRFHPEIFNDAEDAEAYVFEELDRGIHPEDLEMRCQDIAQTTPFRSQEYRVAIAALVVLSRMRNRGDFDGSASSREHGNRGINRRLADEIDLDGVAVRIGQLSEGGSPMLSAQIGTRGRENARRDLDLHLPPGYTRGRLPWNRRETVIPERLAQRFGLQMNAEDRNARSHNNDGQDRRRFPPGSVAPLRRQSDLHRNEDEVQVGDSSLQVRARGQNPPTGARRGYGGASTSINYRYVEPGLDDYDDPNY
ncbi:hypothetical protein B7494_g529 [Chlorociboria aeruginascens]|nr:hypothetical protein B7494_g529 [Chlorociboria aeruginascens]